MDFREHNMIRFIGGVPKYVWYSQHANGEAFTFECLKKDQSGKRVSSLSYPFPSTSAFTSLTILFYFTRFCTHYARSQT